MDTIFTNLQAKNCENILHFNCYFYFLHPISICIAYSIHNMLFDSGRCCSC